MDLALTDASLKIPVFNDNVVYLSSAARHFRASQLTLTQGLKECNGRILFIIIYVTYM